jgi:hypothetical protein
MHSFLWWDAHHRASETGGGYRPHCSMLWSQPHSFRRSTPRKGGVQGAALIQLPTFAASLYLDSLAYLWSLGHRFSNVTVLVAALGGQHGRLSERCYLLPPAWTRRATEQNVSWLPHCGSNCQNPPKGAQLLGRSRGCAVALLTIAPAESELGGLLVRTPKKYENCWHDNEGIILKHLTSAPSGSRSRRSNILCGYRVQLP